MTNYESLDTEINAAASVAALVVSKSFDLKKTYFLIADIAGINPHQGTSGSVTFARFEIQVAQHYEFDVREIGTTSPLGTFQMARNFQHLRSTLKMSGTEMFEVNDDLRSLVSSGAHLLNPQIHQTLSL